ncbi:MAG: HD-GYP domain-containing protein [Candidatus Omnitrophica bacterium]|nr:HD-GYP domain-containing protein [Candidatus Omnitrophota bacterium]
MKETYQEELFKKLIGHPNWKKQLEVFTPFLGKDFTWIAAATGPLRKIQQNDSFFFSNSLPATAEDRLNNLLSETHKTNHIQSIAAAEGHNYSYGLPIARGEQIYGYFLICDCPREIPANILELFQAFSVSTLETVQKEQELTRLYDTIRPKTIALSTVHTIGRIISSTLELDQLLPRIARLSLQVLRARRSVIMLVDGQKKMLNPFAVVDLNDKNATMPPLKLGAGLPGRVAKTGQTVIRPQYLCVPLVAEENVIGTITISHRLDNKAFSIFDQEILTTFSEQAVIAIKNAQLYEEQEKLTLNSIRALASVLSSEDYNFGRSNLFINITMSIGMELKLGSDQMRILYYGAILHNVSQIGLPRKILKKATKLSGKDYQIIREHPLIGAEIIRPIGGKMKDVLPIIIYHHERYDGNGYPSGLRGESIPLGARILAVADSFEAMLSKRPYRKKMSLAQAVSEIVKLSGEQFDPIVVDAFVRVVKRWKNKILRTDKNTWIWKKF